MVNEPAPAAQPTILLIEDNPADVLLVQEALSTHDVIHNLTVIKDGESAIQYIDALDTTEAVCPSLVILDLNLPRKSGRDVLQRMRLSARCAGIPILILSSSDAEKDRSETKALGATAYVRKPSNLVKFLSVGQTVREMLEASSRA